MLDLLVELEVAGDPVHLPPGVDAAAFRIVQEALVNVAHHAAATRALVRVGYEPEAVELVVSDDGDGGGDGPIHDGRGLVNLRERVALYGGELRAGRRRPHGFELRARRPVGSPRRDDPATATHRPRPCRGAGRGHRGRADAQLGPRYAAGRPPCCWARP